MNPPEPSAVPKHQSLEKLFFGVLPPRRVPLGKRLFWRVLLALLSFAPTRALILRLRGA